MFETIAIAAIVVIAGFLQGLTGFGFGLIALPLLGLFIPIKTVIPLIVMLGFCLTLTLTIQLRRSIRFRNMIMLFIATVPGIPLGVYLLKHLSAQPLSLALGALMISFTSYQLMVKPTPRPLGLPWTLTAGFLSGILGGSIGAGGPPVIIYSTMQPWSKDESKATLTFFFFVSTIVILANHAVSGLITGEVTTYFLTSLPALGVGIFLGTIAYKYISDQGYRKLALVLVFLLGCMMIIKNV
ncbi:sulfite exporter TauE/SafE family protein [Pseudodesulfovibrio sp.]|nr:sulfite exporter TauE/SafE family protein [Pseudodesulfovibrio sp.]